LTKVEKNKIGRHYEIFFFEYHFINVIAFCENFILISFFCQKFTNIYSFNYFTLSSVLNN